MSTLTPEARQQLELALLSAEKAMRDVVRALGTANTAASPDGLVHFGLMPVLKNAADLQRNIRALHDASKDSE